MDLGLVTQGIRETVSAGKLPCLKTVLELVYTRGTEYSPREAVRLYDGTISEEVFTLGAVGTCLDGETPGPSWKS